MIYFLLLTLFCPLLQGSQQPQWYIQKSDPSKKNVEIAIKGADAKTTTHTVTFKQENLSYNFALPTIEYCPRSWTLLGPIKSAHNLVMLYTQDTKTEPNVLGAYIKGKSQENIGGIGWSDWQGSDYMAIDPFTKKTSENNWVARIIYHKLSSPIIHCSYRNLIFDNNNASPHRRPKISIDGLKTINQIEWTEEGKSIVSYDSDSGIQLSLMHWKDNFSDPKEAVDRLWTINQNQVFNSLPLLPLFASVLCKRQTLIIKYNREDLSFDPNYFKEENFKVEGIFVGNQDIYGKYFILRLSTKDDKSNLIPISPINIVVSYFADPDLENEQKLEYFIIDKQKVDGWESLPLVRFKKSANSRYHLSAGSQSRPPSIIEFNSRVDVITTQKTDYPPTFPSAEELAQENNALIKETNDLKPKAGFTFKDLFIPAMFLGIIYFLFIHQDKIFDMVRA